jgi:hypothetical protein
MKKDRYEAIQKDRNPLSQQNNNNVHTSSKEIN